MSFFAGVKHAPGKPNATKGQASFWFWGVRVGDGKDGSITQDESERKGVRGGALVYFQLNTTGEA